MELHLLQEAYLIVDQFTVIDSNNRSMITHKLLLKTGVLDDVEIEMGSMFDQDSISVGWTLVLLVTVAIIIVSFSSIGGLMGDISFEDLCKRTVSPLLDDKLVEFEDGVKIACFHSLIGPLDHRMVECISPEVEVSHPEEVVELADHVELRVQWFYAV